MAVMTAMLRRVRDRAWIQAQMDESARERMIAERTFAVMQAIYYRRHPESRVTAEFHAAANPCVKAAIADAKWHGDRVQVLKAQLDRLGGVS